MVTSRSTAADVRGKLSQFFIYTLGIFTSSLRFKSKGSAKTLRFLRFWRGRDVAGLLRRKELETPYPPKKTVSLRLSCPVSNIAPLLQSGSFPYERSFFRLPLIKAQTTLAAAERHCIEKQLNKKVHDFPGMRTSDVLGIAPWAVWHFSQNNVHDTGHCGPHSACS